MLFVHDKCQPDPGNYELSRRFVLYDADDTEITTRPTYPLSVTSAAANTTYTWQVDVASSGDTQVSLDWAGHFINEVHHTNGLLKQIADFLESIDAG